MDGSQSSDPSDPSDPSGADDCPDGVTSEEAPHESLGAWPPRISDPPPLPYASDAAASLSLDESARVPEEPDFTRGRLEKERGSSDVGPVKPPGVVPFDPKNPSGRTRGDAILRCTEADVEARLQQKRCDAAIYGACLVLLLTIFISDVPLLWRAGFVAVGGGVGWLAYELGDSEITWTLGMFLAAVVCTWHLSPLQMSIYGGFFVAAGWIAGFTRDASLTA